jgi:protein-S-isoprenylcysteine O-methyltransferase Ste14
VWPVLIVVCHGVVPQLVSLLTARHGWVEGRPGIWNVGGLLLVILGSALLIAVFATHFGRIPKRVTIELRAPWQFTPPYVVANGPYRFTRHPMYVAILALWFGWALFYGSGAVMGGCLILLIAINLVARREERALEMRFGDAYRHYRTAVPRWFGII